MVREVPVAAEALEVPAVSAAPEVDSEAEDLQWAEDVPLWAAASATVAAGDTDLHHPRAGEAAAVAACFQSSVLLPWRHLGCLR